MCAPNRRLMGPAIWLSGALAAFAQDFALSTQPTTSRAGLDVGDPAPPIAAEEWLGGPAPALGQPAERRIVVLVFWASWSGPSRSVLPEVARLRQAYSPRGVIVAGVTEEPPEEARAFVERFEPGRSFPTALDTNGKLTAAYCRAVGVDFVPYAFVVGPDGLIAWHGHPLQPELAQIIEKLLSGTYDAGAARELVRQAQSVSQLERLFRDAYAGGSWRTALLALDGLLKKDVSKPRLLRYKLSILLGDLGDLEEARRLGDELLRDYAGDARFLNSVAWDVWSDSRLYERDPELGLKLARAAYDASGGRDAAVADTYARALHLIGRTDLAVRVQESAVARSNSEQRAEHQRRLEFYRRCQELRGQLGAEQE